MDRRKITLIIGDNEELIFDEFNSLVNIEDEDLLDNTKFIRFPEEKTHPKVYCAELRNDLIEYNNSNFIILTFSNDIIDLLSNMISTGNIINKEIEIRLIKQDEIIFTTFNENGELKDFCKNYLDWKED